MPTALPAPRIQGTMVGTAPQTPPLYPHPGTRQPLTSILGPAEDGGHLLALRGVAAVPGDAGADAHRPLVGFDAAEVSGGRARAVGHLRVGVVGLEGGDEATTIITTVTISTAVHDCHHGHHHHRRHHRHHHHPNPGAPLPVLHQTPIPPVCPSPLLPLDPPFPPLLPPAWLHIALALRFDAFCLFSAHFLARRERAAAASIPRRARGAGGELPGLPIS